MNTCIAKVSYDSWNFIAQVRKIRSRPPFKGGSTLEVFLRKNDQADLATNRLPNVPVMQGESYYFIRSLDRMATSHRVGAAV